MFSLEENQSTKLKDGREELINFHKLRLIYKVCRDVMKFTPSKRLDDLNDEDKNLLDLLCSIPVFDEKELYKRSLDLEPRQPPG